MSLIIEIEDDRWAALPGIKAMCHEAHDAAVPGELREISLLLTGDAGMQRLNREFRGKDSPTNVLSFPAAAMPPTSGAEVPLGDIALAYDTVCREASEASKPVGHHVRHLVIHGILHLVGYDHETEGEADVMEDLERQILARIGIPDPYSA